MTSISIGTATETPGTNNDDPGADSVLVRPEWLADHLDDPLVTVIEVDVSDAGYRCGHISGALLWNVYSDLKDQDYRTVDIAAIRRLIARSGIDDDTTVVFYGYAPAMGFWFMKLLGHTDVRILDCSRESWLQSGGPWSDVVPAVAPPADAAAGDPVGSLNEGIRADEATVRNAMHRPDRLIADVRTEAEFIGERFWPSGSMDPAGRAGHIPSAVSLPLENLYEADGSFRGRPELQEVFASLGTTTAEVLTYCTIGGRACTAWFVLTYLLGRPNVRVYDGSWAEWGRLPDSAVETGRP